MRSIAVSINVWVIDCGKYVDSKYGMSSLIIKDIKYHILKSLTLVILELLPQTLDPFRAWRIFSIIFPIFFHIFTDIL